MARSGIFTLVLIRKTSKQPACVQGSSFPGRKTFGIPLFLAVRFQGIGFFHFKSTKAHAKLKTETENRGSA